MRPRATISQRNLTVLRRVRLDYWRPSTRADCASVPRPCPFVSCRHNLYLDMKDNGNVRLNFPALEPADLGDSCALDVASEGGVTLERVGQALGVTREMVRQMEAKLLRKLRAMQSDDGAIDAGGRNGAALGREQFPKPWEPRGA